MYVELEWTKTCCTLFWSMESPDKQSDLWNTGADSGWVGCVAYLVNLKKISLRYQICLFRNQRVHSMSLSIQFQPTSLYNLGFICKTQWVEMTSDKIANPFIKTYAGWKIMLEGFQIYNVWYPRLKRIETIIQVAQQIWPNSTLPKLN